MKEEKMLKKIVQNDFYTEGKEFRQFIIRTAEGVLAIVVVVVGGMIINMIKKKFKDEIDAFNFLFENFYNDKC